MTPHSPPCGLCQNIRDLQNSHLLPKASYRHLLDPTRSNPNSVSITRKIMIATSQQVSAPFLCHQCEELFSQKGEDYVLTQCAQHDGQFRLREQLQTATPLCTTPQFTAYDAVALLGDTIDSYLYFAASIFWRAAARRWKIGSEPLRQLSLGKIYQEQFRLYLLDKAPFPSNGRIYLHVASETSPQLLELSFPSSTRVDGIYRHKFYILGLIFVLFLGWETSQRHDSGALNGTQPCILLRPWREDSLFQAGVMMAMASTPVGSLRRRP